MAKEKERFEMLLEEVRDGVKLVAEGHEIIRSEMKQMEERLSEKISFVDDKLGFVAKELGGKIDKVEHKLDEHLRQPVHAVA